MEKSPCVAIVTSPGLTHLTPLIEFAKRLTSFHPEIHAKFIIPTHGPLSTSMKAILEALPSTTSFTLLPPVNIEDLPEEADPAALIHLTVCRSLPSFHEALNSLSSSTRLVALIADPFSVDTLSLAEEFNLLTYIYFYSSAFSLSICLYFPKLDEKTSCEYRDLPEPIKLSGCIPIQGHDLPHPAQNRSSKAYISLLHICKRLRLADGIIINSFMGMEEGAIRALRENEADNFTIYPVGPIIQAGSSSHAGGSECLTWLDTQQPNSVLYVSFGSGGTLSQEQINELALGLELSGQRFLWVVRPPSNSCSTAYLGAANENPLQFLPSGFLERTKGHGLVLPSWAPQIEVLKHGSISGFISHCGWNSILESIVNGVPIIAWPLFAEQKMNAAMLTEGLKVALRPGVNEKGIVEKDEIIRIVKCLMVEEKGREIRKRVKELKDAAAEALKEDGSSAEAILELALKWRNFSGI